MKKLATQAQWKLGENHISGRAVMMKNTEDVEVKV